MLVDDLTLDKPLGKGAFGEVYLTSKMGSKEKFATKKIDKKFTLNPKAKKYLDNEIGVLRDINHENIVKLYDVKETSQFYYLVTEYCNGGDLSKCLEDYEEKYKKPFSEEIVQYLMKQIVSALRYLHNKRILHRDIKLDNILVNFENEQDRKNQNMLKAKVKLIDFGFARYLKKEELAYSTLGSPINMDPGILRKLNKMQHSKDFGYDEKADIWSLGTICYEMLIGKCTFDAESMKDLIKKVEKGDYLIPSSLSKETVSFLNGMLQYDLKRRLTSDQLYRHKFLNKNIKDFQKINLKEIKHHSKGSNIRMNSKELKGSIWDVFGRGSFILDYIPPDVGVIDEAPSGEEEEKEDNYLNIGPKINDRNNTTKNNNNNNIDSGNIYEKKPSIKLPLSQKGLEDEFMKVFELINDDCIYVEPKLIPIIPGDDPAIINKDSEFCDDNI